METEGSAFLKQKSPTLAPDPSSVHSVEKNAHRAKYRLTGETDTQLLERLQGLVDTIARYFIRKVPASVSYDDLVQEGWIGLLDAMERYEMQENADFETYANHRIKGAILDMLRGNDHASRSMRPLVRQAERVWNCLAHRLLREPTSREWQEALPEDMREMFWEIVTYSENPMMSLSQFGVDGEYSEIDLPWEGGASVEDKLIAHEDQDPSKGLSPRLQRAIAELPVRQKVVLFWRYQVPDDEVVLQSEIAGWYGTTKSAVCHLEAKALWKLRKHLGNRQNACL